jgi:hypothetical protein
MNPKVAQDFDELFTSRGTNLNQVGLDAPLIGGLDILPPGIFSAAEFQAGYSISASSSSSWALNDIPWFQFQQLIKTTGPYSHPRTSELDLRLTCILESRVLGLQLPNEPSLSLIHAEFRHAFDLPGSHP